MPFTPPHNFNKPMLTRAFLALWLTLGATFSLAGCLGGGSSAGGVAPPAPVAPEVRATVNVSVAGAASGVQVFYDTAGSLQALSDLPGLPGATFTAKFATDITPGGASFSHLGEAGLTVAGGNTTYLFRRAGGYMKVNASNNERGGLGFFSDVSSAGNIAISRLLTDDAARFPFGVSDAAQLDAMKAANLTAQYVIPAHAAIGRYFHRTALGNDTTRILSNDQAGAFVMDFGAGLGALNLILNAHGGGFTGPAALQTGEPFVTISGFQMGMKTLTPPPPDFSSPVLPDPATRRVDNAHCRSSNGASVVVDGCGGIFTYGGSVVTVSGGVTMTKALVSLENDGISTTLVGGITASLFINEVGHTIDAHAYFHGDNGQDIGGRIKYGHNGNGVTTSIIVDFLGGGFGYATASPIKAEARTTMDRVNLANARYLAYNAAFPVTATGIVERRANQPATVHIGGTAGVVAAVGNPFRIGWVASAGITSAAVSPAAASSGTTRIRPDVMVVGNAEVSTLIVTNAVTRTSPVRFRFELVNGGLYLQAGVNGSVHIAAPENVAVSATLPRGGATRTVYATHNFAIQTHYDPVLNHGLSMSNPTPLDIFVSAEYAAFGLRAANSAVRIDDNPVVVYQLKDFAGMYYGAKTPQRVINHLAAVSWNANYTIPKGAALGFYSNDLSAADSRILRNTDGSGQLNANFGTGIVAVSLRLDGYAATGAKTDDFLYINNFQMSVTENMFSNHHCSSFSPTGAAGSSTGCGGALDYANDAMDARNSETGERGDRIIASGMFAGPSAEEVVGGIEHLTNGSTGNMKVYFLGAGRGGRE